MHFDEAIQLALEVHAMVHLSEMSGSSKPTYEDEIWEGLGHEHFAVMPGRRSFTIAWNLWHITRIEDIVTNILINGSGQILNEDLLKKLNATAHDTGNAMTDQEIADFSAKLNIEELKNYRIAVGRQTESILKNLTPDDIKRKPKPENLARVVAEGALTEQKGSKWLLEFWGKKTTGGLILLPVTRHHIMHLDSCRELKNKILQKG